MILKITRTVSCTVHFGVSYSSLPVMFTKAARWSAILALTLCIVEGFKYFQTKIPNGENVQHPCKPNYLWHGVGHKREGGGGERNIFGQDFDDAGRTWTRELCLKDSDGDGKTNGQELGDPNCNWQPGEVPSVTTGITHPGICDPWEDPICKGKNDWVTCDLESFKCDAVKDPFVRNFTLRFPETSVPGTETNYFCMTFEIPHDDAYHIIANTPYIDNVNVMHHILVFGCKDSADVDTNASSCGMASENCRNLLGAWAVGYSGECLRPDVGIQIGTKGHKKFMMQFHWNNPELRTDYTDSSGMTFYYTNKLRKYNAELMMIGQQYLEIPPNREHVEVTAICTANETREVFAGAVKIARAFNHMHYLGRSQKIELFRDGEKVTDITNDPEYSYDSPIIHEFDTPVEVRPGDTLKTTCIFKSTTRHKTVFYGDGTSDEMCYGFMLYYPKENAKMTQCVQWRGISSNKLYRADVMDGCYVSDFFNASIPETGQMRQLIEENCKAFPRCYQECKEAVKAVRQHPCLQGGDLEEYIRDIAWRYDPYTVRFFSALDSCKLETAMEKCSSQSGNNNMQNSEPDNAAVLCYTGTSYILVLVYLTLYFVQ